MLSRLLALMAFCALPALAATTASAQDAKAPSPKKGDIVYKSDFSSAAGRDKWSKAPFASWVPEGKDGATVLKISVPATEKPGHHKIVMPLNLKPYEGCKLFLRCLAKAKDVTKAPQRYNGVKCMLHFKSESGEHYYNENSVYGTFDWKELGVGVFVDKGVERAELLLGLEMCVGEVLFDDVELIVSTPPVQERPAPMANAPPVFKGHDLPRLRGAMSPQNFKEEDFELFADGWNANLVRWQMTRFWGKANTDLDLAGYDKWIDDEMADLDKLLACALKRRFLVVVDLHSPPGGRYEDRSMRMFYEKKYNDHFVKVWRKLATRYKGHPAIWAYDLINEPVECRPAEAGMDYLATQTRAAKAIREIDPKTPIIIEALDWDSPRGYNELMPVPLPHIIYQVHMYEPGTFTHQGVHNTMGVGSGEAGIVYPGVISGIKYDKAKLKAVLKPVRDFQLAYNVQIYVGEFSAIRWAPGAAQYLSDCIDIFEEYGWDWTYHAFREWPGWSVEHEGPGNDTRPSADNDRKQVLMKWFKLNKKPEFQK